MKYLFAALGLVVVALLVWLLLRPAAAPEPVVLGPPPYDDVVDDAAAVTGMVPAGTATAAPEAGPEEIVLDPGAVASLRGARELGFDPRTPPIGRDAPREEPTAEELADPDKYAEFESRQERKIKRAYVIEAEKYVRQLRADIEKGKAMGITPEEIAKVEEKARRIEEMRAKLLADDPGLLTAPGGNGGDTGGK